MEKETKFQKLLENDKNSSPSRNEKVQRQFRKQAKKEQKLQEKRKKMLEEELSFDKKYSSTASHTMGQEVNNPSAFPTLKEEDKNELVPSQELSNLEIASSYDDGDEKTPTYQDSASETNTNSSTKTSKIDFSEIAKLKKEMGIEENQTRMFETTEPPVSQTQEIQTETEPQKPTAPEQKTQAGVSKIDFNEIRRLKAELGINNDSTKISGVNANTNTSEQEQNPAVAPANKPTEKVQEQNDDDFDITKPSIEEVKKLAEEEEASEKAKKAEESSKFRLFKRNFGQFDFSFDEEDEDNLEEGSSTGEENNQPERQENFEDTDHSQESLNTDFVPAVQRPQRPSFVTASMVNEGDEEKKIAKPKIQKPTEEPKEKKPEQERIVLTGEAREKKQEELMTKYNAKANEEASDGGYKKSLDFSINTSLKKFKVKPPKKLFVLLGVFFGLLAVIGTVVGVILATRPPEPIVLKSIKLSQEKTTQVVGETLDLRGIYIDYVYSNNTTKRIEASTANITYMSNNINSQYTITGVKADTYVVFSGISDDGKNVGEDILRITVLDRELTDITVDFFISTNQETSVIKLENILAYATYDLTDSSGTHISTVSKWVEPVALTITITADDLSVVALTNNMYVLDQTKTYEFKALYNGKNFIKQIHYDSLNLCWVIENQAEVA